MADFNKGDRIVKMSGVNAGKYGTINSISDSGTLNVTFDGERLPRFCDPERCGKIGLNAKYKVGDKVRIIGGGVETIASVHPKGQGTGFGPKEVDYYATRESDGFITDNDISGVANARACNAKFKVGDKVAYSVFGQTKTGTVVEVAEKFHSEYGNEHEGEQTYMVDFGKKPYSKTWESRMTLANSRARNASIDDEFPKLKAMGKANAEKYLKDNSQSLIDKYGYPEFVKLAKKIQSIRRKPIKKGRFAGKSGDMTYYVDYTADSMHASRYGKDGTNVTEIQVTGPYVMDPDGKERRHILYYYRSGTESIPAQSSEVRSLVSSIMRGPDVVKQGDAAFAWNACGEDK